MNQFGAKAKLPYFRPHVTPSSVCAEFGASSGNILGALNCAHKVGIELNACARDWGSKNLGLAYVERTSELRSDSFDFVYTTSVLEHVECPLCEIREIYRVLHKGGIFVAQVPGMAPPSMKFKSNDINKHLQVFGALELGNTLVGAGFTVTPANCSSEVTQWPVDYERKFEELGEKGFQEASREWAKTHDKLVTTTCVAEKI
jgi:Methylase involved in ubiquinone/menaquinone biosynthesis